MLSVAAATVARNKSRKGMPPANGRSKFGHCRARGGWRQMLAGFAAMRSTYHCHRLFPGHETEARPRCTTLKLFIPFAPRGDSQNPSARMGPVRGRDSREVSDVSCHCEGGRIGCKRRRCHGAAVHSEGSRLRDWRLNWDKPDWALAACRDQRFLSMFGPRHCFSEAGGKFIYE